MAPGLIRFAASAALLASTAGCNLDLPPGCADILVARSDEARCVSGPRCDAVIEDPTYVARWLLFIGEYAQHANGDDVPYSADEMAERRRCVAEYLDNRGVVLIDRGSDSTPYITAEGVEKNFRAILDFEPVRAYELQCSGGVCERCVDLDTSACAQDPFCFVLDAQAWDEANACLEATTPVACQSGDLGCGGAETWARSPEGACWRFASTCVPEGWTEPDEACQALGFEGPYCM